MAEIEFSNAAEADLVEIDAYSAAQFGEDTAFEYMHGFDEAFARLRDYPQSGRLKPDQVTKIVNFYAYCKSAIDSTRHDGPHADALGTTDAAVNMVSVHQLLVAILNLGNEIIQMPKNSIKYQSDAAKELNT